MKRSISALTFIFLAGCSTVQGHTQAVKIICPITDTVVMVNGKKTACPSTVDLPRNRVAIIEAYKTGYAPVTRNIDYHFGTYGKLDLVGTAVWFFPVFGVLTPGAWDLDTDEVQLDLIKL